jgi:hypothetical protein
VPMFCLPQGLNVQPSLIISYFSAAVNRIRR